MIIYIGSFPTVVFFRLNGYVGRLKNLYPVYLSTVYNIDLSFAVFVNITQQASQSVSQSWQGGTYSISFITLLWKACKNAARRRRPVLSIWLRMRQTGIATLCVKKKGEPVL